jgi:hypothetical protein
MKAISSVVLAVLVLLSVATLVPKSEALPQSEIYRVYYDANQDWQGDRFVGCSGSTSTSGTRIGAQWMEVESMHCETFATSYSVYAWCDGNWTGVAGVGSPCP